MRIDVIKCKLKKKKTPLLVSFRWVEKSHTSFGVPMDLVSRTINAVSSSGAVVTANEPAWVCYDCAAVRERVSSGWFWGWVSGADRTQERGPRRQEGTAGPEGESDVETGFITGIPCILGGPGVSSLCAWGNVATSMHTHTHAHAYTQLVLALQNQRCLA